MAWWEAKVETESLKQPTDFLSEYKIKWHEPGDQSEGSGKVPI